MNQDEADRRAEEVELPEAKWWYTDDSQAAMTINFDLPAEKPLFTESQVREAIAAALVKYTQGQKAVGYVTGDEATRRMSWEPDQAAFDIPLGTKLYIHPIPSQQEERVRELEQTVSAYKWAYEYLQSRMESLDRHGWAHDCDGEIEARLDSARSKEQGK